MASRKLLNDVDASTPPPSPSVPIKEIHLNNEGRVGSTEPYRVPGDQGGLAESIRTGNLSSLPPNPLPPLYPRPAMPAKRDQKKSDHNKRKSHNLALHVSNPVKLRKRADEKVVRLGSVDPRTVLGGDSPTAPQPGGIGFRQSSVASVGSQQGTAWVSPDQVRDTLKEDERKAHDLAEKRTLVLTVLGLLGAIKVFVLYLITLDSILSCGLTIGLTIYWYYRMEDQPSYSGGGMDWVLLGFAVVTPLSIVIQIAFRRREQALLDITRIRSFSYHLYIAHALWDWGSPPGPCRTTSGVDWLEHTDLVLEQLVGIGDELCRFLTLPTFSRTRHRVLRSGRREAARTVEVAYRLFDMICTQRMLKLAMLTEDLKAAGLPAGEISRISQYARFINEMIEDLRTIKTYRTPQALRAFGRLFTVFLPPFYAPTFSQLSLEMGTLAIGIIFSAIASLGLCALFESQQVLEDPFVAYISLDGVDVREELKVLHWQQLVNARRIIFPSAPPFPALSCKPVTWDVPTQDTSAKGVPPEDDSLSYRSLNSVATLPKGEESKEIHDEEDIETDYRLSNFALSLDDSQRTHRRNESGVPSLGGSLHGSLRRRRLLSQS